MTDNFPFGLSFNETIPAKWCAIRQVRQGKAQWVLQLEEVVDGHLRVLATPPDVYGSLSDAKDAMAKLRRAA